MSLRLSPTFADQLAARPEGGRPLAGMWVASGSPVLAEICAGSGLDWLLIDMEHVPNDLMRVQQQLQGAAAYPITSVVRVPIGDPVILKQVLDTGAQNVLVPMVNTAEQAQELVEAVHYPPRGRRGVGAALARSARWGRISDYLPRGSDYVSLLVQVETLQAVENAADIAAVDGVDGIFVGPSDLAASMGLIGQQNHPDVTAAVDRVFAEARAAGVPVGVNAFDPTQAQTYVDAGADFLLVSSDVTLVVQGSDALARRWSPDSGQQESTSY